MKVSNTILTVFLLSLSWTASSEAAGIPNELLERSADSSRSLRNERAVPRDLLEVLLNVVVKTQSDRFETVSNNYNGAEDRIAAFVEWFNDLVGYDVLVVGTTSVSTDSAAIIDVVEAYAATLISQQYSGNAFMKTFVTTAVNTALETTVENLNISLDREVSLELLKNIVAVATINNSTSDDSTTTDNSTTTDTSSTDDTSSSSKSLAGRSLLSEDLDLDDSELVPRLAGGSSRAVASVVTNWLNKRAKALLANIFTSYYSVIGLVVTYPLRYLLNQILNIVLPCTTCTSLV